jgi:NADH:ubiquinone oxidoreductase subunit E
MMPETEEHTITICMGSSCFSRGNSYNLQMIKQFIETSGIDISISTTGHLCEGLCNEGPNLMLDGHMYHRVNPSLLKSLLNEKFGLKERL